MACQYSMSGQILGWPDTLPGCFIHFIRKIKLSFLGRLDIIATCEGKKGKEKNDHTKNFT